MVIFWTYMYFLIGIKSFKIDVVINNLSSEAFHIFFIRGKSLVNLNLHHFLASREDNICR